MMHIPQAGFRITESKGFQDPEKFYHGRCFIDLLGLDGLLNLPQDQTDKLMLDDIGEEAMRALIEQRR